VSPTTVSAPEGGGRLRCMAFRGDASQESQRQGWFPPVLTKLQAFWQTAFPRCLHPPPFTLSTPARAGSLSCPPGSSSPNATGSTDKLTFTAGAGQREIPGPGLCGKGTPQGRIGLPEKSLARRHVATLCTAVGLLVKVLQRSVEQKRRGLYVGPPRSPALPTTTLRGGPLQPVHHRLVQRCGVSVHPAPGLRARQRQRHRGGELLHGLGCGAGGRGGAGKGLSCWGRGCRMRKSTPPSTPSRQGGGG
jgi:hypothetical protein